MTTNALNSSFVEYFNDVKPYHVKLSNIQDQIVFAEEVKIKLLDKIDTNIILGSNINKADAQSFASTSWIKNYSYDGVKKSWSIPVVSFNKKNVVTELAADSLKQIPGLTAGIFNPTNWVGPTVEYVKGDSQYLQDTVDYVFSHGMFSFETFLDSRWKQYNLSSLTRAKKSSGVLKYIEDNYYFKILNVVNGAYDEWSIKCIDLDTQTCSVTGKYNGFIGTVAVGSSFSHPLFSFDLDYGKNFTSASIDDEDVFTPQEKITILSGGVPEIWTLIKTNPLVMSGGITFVAGAIRDENPSLIVHPSSMGNNASDSTWQILFSSATEFTILKDAVVVEPIVDVKDGCSFKSPNIHFSLVPAPDGFVAGDSFTFSVKAGPAVYKLFGSVSGWQTDVQVGDWYWNGKVGFKIPALSFETKYENTSVYINEYGEWLPGIKTSQLISDISFSYGHFMITGEGSFTGLSGDGVNWQSGAGGLVVDPNQRFFAFDENGDLYRYYETGTGGSKYWRKHTTGINNKINSSVTLPNFITGVNGESLDCTIAVGDNGGIYSSVDLAGFLQNSSGTISNLNDIAFSNDCIIAVGDGGKILYSTDRITWIHRNSFTTDDITGICFSVPLSRFVAVGKNGTIITSIDGITWSNLSVLMGIDFTDVVFGGNKFMAVSGQQGIIAESADGMNWSTSNGPILSKIAYGNDKFIGTVRINSNKKLELNATISEGAEPVEYTVTFLTDTYASVESSKSGFLQGLKLNESWTDENITFEIDSSLIQVESNDTFRIIFGYEAEAIKEGDYDDLMFDTQGYDDELGKFKYIKSHLESYFPLYYGRGAIVPLRNDISVYEISKIAKDSIYFNLKNASQLYPELAASGDWVPLYFKFKDSDISETNFPDLVLTIEAYLCGNKDQRVFSIEQPRYKSQLFSKSATMTLDQTFIDQYIPFAANFKIAIKSDKTYGQTVNVRVTENLFITDRDKILFDAIINLDVIDSTSTAYIASNESMTENVVITVNDDAIVDSSEKAKETAASSIFDSLKIQISDPGMTTIVLSYSDEIIVNETADKYLINHSLSDSSPNIIVESLDNLGVIGNPVGDVTSESGHVYMSAISFSLPAGFTVPFKLKLV